MDHNCQVYGIMPRYLISLTWTVGWLLICMLSLLASVAGPGMNGPGAWITKDTPDKSCHKSKIRHTSVWRISDLRWNLSRISFVSYSTKLYVTRSAKMWRYGQNSLQQISKSCFPPLGRIGVSVLRTWLIDWVWLWKHPMDTQGCTR